MAEVTVGLIWDGDPDAPDSTAQATEMTISVLGGTIGVEVTLEIDDARKVWADIGHFLRKADGEGLI